MDYCERPRALPAKVYLYEYPITKIGVRILSVLSFKNISHSTIVVSGGEDFVPPLEYEFSDSGIETNNRTEESKKPSAIQFLGHTIKSKDELENYVRDIGVTFNGNTYNVAELNCHDFSDALSVFLIGNSIPDRFRTMGDTVARNLSIVGGSCVAIAGKKLVWPANRRRKDKTKKNGMRFYKTVFIGTSIAGCFFLYKVIKHSSQIKCKREGRYLPVWKTQNTPT